MTIIEIVSDYLRKNGYDGLYNQETQCGCHLDDLFICAPEIDSNCKPGHKITCKECGAKDSEEGCIYSDDEKKEIEFCIGHKN